MPDLPGYADLEEIGRGGSATVYRAWQEQFQRRVALKILAVDMTDRRAQQRFERERALTGRLTGHPHVVRVFDAGFVKGRRPYLAMEYFERGSLADRITARGPLDLPEALRVAVKVSGALETAHRARILHRDIKPQNILVSRYGEPALADFGIATLVSLDMSVTGTMTPVHAAPELLEGDAPSPASDIYALGSTIFTLLAGSAPFLGPPGEGVLTQLMRIMASELPPLDRPDVSISLRDVLRRSMAKTPGARYDSAADLGEALRHEERSLGLVPTEMTLEVAESDTATGRRQAAPAAPARVWAAPPPPPPSPLERLGGDTTASSRLPGLRPGAIGDPGRAGAPAGSRPAATGPAPAPAAATGPAPAAPAPSASGTHPSTSAPPGMPVRPDRPGALSEPAGAPDLVLRAPPQSPQVEDPATVTASSLVGGPTVAGQQRRTPPPAGSDPTRTHRVRTTLIGLGAALVVAGATLAVVHHGSSPARTTVSTGATGATGATRKGSATTSTSTTSTTLDVVADTPTGLTAQINGSTALLNWTDNTKGRDPQLVYLSPAGGRVPQSVAKGATSATITGLTAGAGYCFQVVAVLAIPASGPAVTATSAPACVNGAIATSPTTTASAP
jgi:serine/threonine-protein kinase PknK